MKKLLFLILPTAIILFSGCSENKESGGSGTFSELYRKLEALPYSDPSYPQLLDSIFRVAAQDGNPEEKVKALTKKGEMLNDQGKYEQAIVIFNDAVKLADSNGLSFLLGRNIENRGRALFRMMDRRNAIISMKRAADVYEASGDSTGLGSALNNIGFIYWQESLFDSAVIYFNKALDIRKRLNNNDHHATTLNNLGTIYFNWSLYDKALEYFMKSLELQKAINNAYGITISLSNIGQVYSETSQHDEAIEYYRESLEYAFNSKDTSVIGYAYHGLGSAFEFINPDSAGYYLKLSLDTYLTTEDFRGIMLGLKGVGEYYLKQKYFEYAENYFRQMLDLSREQNITIREAEALQGLGNVNLATGNLEAAKKYFIQGIDASTKVNNKQILSGIYLALSDIHERSGNRDSALIALKRHLDYSRLINEEEMSRRLIGLKNKFQFQKYEDDLQQQIYRNEVQRIVIIASVALLILILIIALLLYRLSRRKDQANKALSEKNTMIESQAVELAAANKELVDLGKAKDKLFSIIAHDLRSPFQIFLGNTEILLSEYNDLSNEERLELIEMLRETGVNTYALVENLLNLSASRTGTLNFDPKRFDIVPVLNEIEKLYSPQALAKKVKLVTKKPETLETFGDVNMISIVLRNLINNAVKYSHENGTIEIRALRSDGGVKICVCDNGLGIEEKTLEGIFNLGTVKSKLGTSGEKGTGLGLGLCREFVEKHGGTLTVESEYGIGTTISVNLPG